MEGNGHPGDGLALETAFTVFKTSYYKGPTFDLVIYLSFDFDFLNKY